MPGCLLANPITLVDMGKVPLVAIRWLAQNATSDVELAQLSNVSREWRLQVGLSISTPSCASRLLLPSMIRFSKNKISSSSISSKTRQSLPDVVNNYCQDLDSFCAAWFAPSGIQSIPVSTLPLDDRQNELFSRIMTGGVRNCHCCFEWRGYREASQVLSPFGYHPNFVDNLLCKSVCSNSNNRESTPAVRGATLARPEGYCECWDVSSDQMSNSEQTLQNDCPDTNLAMVRRGILQRQLLPRVIRSSYWKNPRNPTIAGKQQPAVQFLNSSGSNAVRLFTPPFACGPLIRQITIFCVGIATEDGCFLSGLSRRCEFGHMYAQCERDNITDMSSICMSYQRAPPHTIPILTPDDDEFDDDSSAPLDSPDGCTCAFHCIKSFLDAESVHGGDEEVNPPDSVHKGTLGPGHWHCYTVVIDGDECIIRIDGAEESMTHFVQEDSSVGDVVLDGLTIGSDHSFNFSLCFGNGAPGEGEGSISELIVFQGRLPLPDLQVLEDHLMRKHGLTTVATSEMETQLLQQEDDWRRTSRALIEQSAPYDMVMASRGVPLRVVANEPSVSWERKNSVTGEQIPVARIGCRHSQESSDW